MNAFREQWLKEREEEDIQLYEKIKDNPKPAIADLWLLMEERFIEWRKRHDFPQLLNHFDQTLTLFKEWKQAYNLTNEIIISTGFITPFLEHKKMAEKDKCLFLTKQVFKEHESTIVAYSRLEGTRQDLGRTFEFTPMMSFVSYLDWLKTKGKSQVILYINARTAPNSPYEQVYIHKDVYKSGGDFELLKMGGIDTPVNGLGMLYRGKALEFVNLCGLRFAGDISFGEEGNLSCTYCACDNWIATDFYMPLVTFGHCSVDNFNIINSKLQQWSFYDCLVAGDFVNSKLQNVDIIGGNFRPLLQDCTLHQTKVSKDPNILDNNFYALKTFKKIYQQQGDDDIAKYYFIQENEFIRRQLKGWHWFTKTISYYYWEYGRKPHRIIYFSLAIIFIFGLTYYFARTNISLNATSKEFTFGDGFYFSTITFTTLGYGDFSPTGWLKILCSIEAFAGVVNMGFLIAGYSNNKY